MIKKIYQVPVELHLHCDKCGTEMEFEGKVLISDPPQYPHICPKCGTKKIMEAQYPHIEYERKSAISDMFQTNTFNSYLIHEFNKRHNEQNN